VNIFERSESIELIRKRGTGITLTIGDLAMEWLSAAIKAVPGVARVGVAFSDWWYRRRASKDLGDLMATSPGWLVTILTKKYDHNVKWVHSLLRDSAGDLAQSTAKRIVGDVYKAIIPRFHGVRPLNEESVLAFVKRQIMAEVLIELRSLHQIPPFAGPPEPPAVT
jgi:hypothetical protein